MIEKEFEMMIVLFEPPQSEVTGEVEEKEEVQEKEKEEVQEKEEDQVVVVEEEEIVKGREKDDGLVVEIGIGNVKEDQGVATQESAEDRGQESECPKRRRDGGIARGPGTAKGDQDQGSASTGVTGIVIAQECLATSLKNQSRSNKNLKMITQTTVTLITTIYH